MTTTHSGASRISRAVLALALAIMVGLGLSHAPAAHASGSPTVVQSATVDDQTGMATHVTVTLPNPVASGDFLLVLCGVAGGSDTICDVPVDGLSSIFSYAQAAQDGLNDWSEAFYAGLTSSGYDGVDVPLIHYGGSWALETVTVVEISNTSGPDGEAYLVENGTGGTSHVSNTYNNLGTGNSELTFAIGVDPGAYVALSAGGSASDIGTNNSPNFGVEHDQIVASGGPSAMEIDSASGLSYYSMVAISFAP